MNREAETRVKSPSRIVWRTQMSKGVNTPHRVSKVTCVINQHYGNTLTDHLKDLGLEDIYVESGRVVRKYLRRRPLGLPGKSITLQDTPVNIYRFTVPRDISRGVIRSVIEESGLYQPGRGTVFVQDLIEFYRTDPPRISESILPDVVEDRFVPVQKRLVTGLTYLTCVLSQPGSAEKLARLALELGICVPVVTHGSATDIRDQLGLIRITIPSEKEILHLVMPEQDSDSIARLIIEAAGLDRKGSGFIYRTPVGAGLPDILLRLGQQEHAATIEQMIAAIDQIKGDTSWRKRISPDHGRVSTEDLIPDHHCEVTAICHDDRSDMLIDAAIKAGASGATTSRVKKLVRREDEAGYAAQSHSTISVPAAIIDDVVDAMLEMSNRDYDGGDRIQVLDSPAAYVQTW